MATPLLGKRARIIRLQGVIDVSTTINLSNTVGTEVRGAGRHETVLRWVGPPDIPMFRRDQCRDSVIADLSIELAAPLKCVVQGGTILRDTTGQIVCTGNRTENIRVQADQTNWLGGYAVYGGQGYENINNEFNVDENVYCDGVGTGIQYNGSNCKGNIVS